jgi:PAS domain S-box-containing protein
MRYRRASLAVIGILALLLVAAPSARAKSQAVVLTPQEQEWLREHPVIRLAPDPDFQPIEYFDEDGAYRGAAADIVRLLEKKLGLKITIVRMRNWDEVMDGFHRGDVDLLGAIVRTPNRERFALFTDTLVSVPGGIFTRAENARDLTLSDLIGKKVAVVSNYTAHDVLKSRYPGIVLDVVPDISTGLAKASLGMVDAYVENMANATFYSQKAGITNLRLAGTTDFEYRWAIGVRKDWPQLQGILNQGLAAIGGDERKAALRRWISVRSVGWRPGSTFVVGVVAAVLGFLLAVSVAWNRSLRKARAVAQSSEQRFKTLFHNISDPVYIAGSDGRILAANRRASDETGYAPEELLRLRVPDIDVTAGSDDVASQHTRLFSERPSTFEAVHRRKDGTSFPVEINARGIDFAGVPAILGVARNITERKRLEEALRVSLEKYRVLVESFPLGISITDPDGNIIETNRLAEQWVGGNGVAGDGCAVHPYLGQVIRPDGSRMPPDECVAGRALREGRLIANVEMGVVNDAGAATWLSVTAAPIPLPGFGVAVAYADVTDRIRAEAEKDRLGSQLQQAMKMEAIGRLAGGIAHDFNNLLTVITGNIALALMKLPTSRPERTVLGEASKAADRAATLTRQLLAFSRKQIIEPKVVDLNGLIANLHKMLVRLIGENVELQTKLCRELGAVKVDPGQLEQILVNLAVNARDAMPDGGKVVIETSNTDPEGDRTGPRPIDRPERFVLLSVRDTGHGMSAEVMAHVFEPFFTTKPVGHGTGLGLAMVYGVVKQSGGSVEVRSEVGRGTTFRIFLPRISGDPQIPEIEEQTAPSRGRSETVLVVEDEKMVRDLTVRLLEQFGYRVLHVSSGPDALELAKRHSGRIDLLVTDVVMPEMNGSVLAEALRRIRPETKVLFTSGYAGDAIARHGVLDEGVAFLAKPYAPSVLAQKVREVLDEGV